MSEKKVKVIGLDINNVQRIKAVSLDNIGNTTVIGGRNAQGKTSVLDAIMFALAGNKAVSDKPLRKGTKKGISEVRLDNGFVVTRTFTKSGGGSLTIKNENGDTKTSPQKLLDEIFTGLSFSPLSFMQKNAKEQGEILRRLIGIDFDSLNEKRSAFYDQRTEINRDIKRLKTRLDDLSYHDDAPEKEISSTDIAEEMRKANEQKAENDAARRVRALLESDLKRTEERIIELEMEMKKHQKAIKDIQTELAANDTSKLVDPDIDAIGEKLSTIESDNRRVRENREYNQAESELKEAEKHSSEFTKEIEKIDQKKNDLLAGAEFPIDGLSFDEDGAVLFQDIPLAQASASEQLRISLSIGLALNPKSGLMLIRDGSLLDDDNLEMIRQIADRSGGQFFIERVGHGNECEVIIEDGELFKKED